VDCIHATEHEKEWFFVKIVMRDGSAPYSFRACKNQDFLAKDSVNDSSNVNVIW
jgi:hypothetical protein